MYVEFEWLEGSWKRPLAKYLSLIRHLLDNGGNPNVHRSPQRSTYWRVPYSGTALDMFAGWLMNFNSLPLALKETSSEELQTSSEVLLQLVNNGAEYSRPLNTSEGIEWHLFHCTHFDTEIEQFRRFPEQVEGRVHRAIQFLDKYKMLTWNTQFAALTSL